VGEDQGDYRLSVSTWVGLNLSYHDTLEVSLVYSLNVVYLIADVDPVVYIVFEEVVKRGSFCLSTASTDRSIPFS
jgi:hypothetical protein